MTIDTLVFTRVQFMDQVRDHFLAGAAFPEDAHRYR